MRHTHCVWNCGKRTKNRSRICSDCWKAAELMRSQTDEGHNEWLKRWRAKEAAHAINPKKQAAGRKAAARKAELELELPASELLGIG
jgi:hypothetical protein